MATSSKPVTEVTPTKPATNVTSSTPVTNEATLSKPFTEVTLSNAVTGPVANTFTPVNKRKMFSRSSNDKVTHRRYDSEDTPTKSGKFREEVIRVESDTSEDDHNSNESVMVQKKSYLVFNAESPFGKQEKAKTDDASGISHTRAYKGARDRFLAVIKGGAKGTKQWPWPTQEVLEFLGQNNERIHGIACVPRQLELLWLQATQVLAKRFGRDWQDHVKYEKLTSMINFDENVATQNPNPPIRPSRHQKELENKMLEAREEHKTLMARYIPEEAPETSSMEDRLYRHAKLFWSTIDDYIYPKMKPHTDNLFKDFQQLQEERRAKGNATGGPSKKRRRSD